MGLLPQRGPEDVRTNLYGPPERLDCAQIQFQIGLANFGKAHPLIEPSVIPLTKSRIEKVKRTITGMLAMA